MQDDISGWNDWEAAFGNIPELESPSELHGLLMGIVTVAEAPTAEEWQHILKQLDFEALTAEALALLTEEAEDIAAALADDSLDYMPLLPDDQHPLAERVQCLADWCNGVVLGFGLASGQLRADESELLQDLQDVAAVEFDAEDDDDEGEASYAELVEFVRLIPVSLATGRKKHVINQTALFKTKTEKSETTLHAASKESDDGATAASNNISIVEMFTPERPS